MKKHNQTKKFSAYYPKSKSVIANLKEVEKPANIFSEDNLIKILKEMTHVTFAMIVCKKCKAVFTIKLTAKEEEKIAVIEAMCPFCSYNNKIEAIK